MQKNSYLLKLILHLRVFIIVSFVYTHMNIMAIERKHRHIVDMGLSLLVGASLPLKF